MFKKQWKKILSEKLKGLDLTKADKEFLLLIENYYDKTLALTGLFVIDVIALDDRLAELDKDYDNMNCIYKGEVCSMIDYVEKKYGKVAREILNRI